MIVDLFVGAGWLVHFLCIFHLSFINDKLGYFETNGIGLYDVKVDMIFAAVVIKEVE